jgi:hypothetical protein
MSFGVSKDNFQFFGHFNLKTRQNGPRIARDLMGKLKQGINFETVEEGGSVRGRTGGSVGRVSDSGSQPRKVLFRSNLGQDNLHLLTSTKPVIPTGSIN